MRGLIEEGKQTLEEDFPEALLDSAIICAAQKVEHYEIAGYGTVNAWARELGLADVAELLEATLMEEKEADEMLTQLSADIFRQAENIDRGAGEEEGGSAERKVTKKANGRSRRRAS